MNINTEQNDLRKTPDEMKEILKKIHEALCEKGYDPARQIAGYILSEDPVYITDWKNARGMIGHINRDDLLIELIKNYLEA
ncbi:MAG: IreB family regulatory phosphoprotein [Clostridia bacterium]|nr:IreB family regulatory phosphoprotein [Clostridia bacterium]